MTSHYVHTQTIYHINTDIIHVTTAATNGTSGNISLNTTIRENLISTTFVSINAEYLHILKSSTMISQSKNKWDTRHHFAQVKAV